MALSMFHITMQKSFLELEKGSIKDLDRAFFDCKHSGKIWTRAERNAELISFRRDARTIRQRRSTQLLLYNTVRLILPFIDLYN
jgi:hypothetical protein